MAAIRSRTPKNLYLASQERIESARHLWHRRDFVGAMYFGGLAVECILQALAIADGAAHVAHHDLSAWLRICPARLSDAIQRGPASADWSRVIGDWRSDLRFLDHDALLSHLRRIPRWRKLRGDNHARIRQYVRESLNCAEAVQRKGVAQWLHSHKSERR